MTIRQHPVFGRVVEAMQSAEEIGGCEPHDYAPLMAEVEREARTRRLTFLRIWAEANGTPLPVARALFLRFPFGGRALLAFAVVLSWAAVWGVVDIGARVGRLIFG